MKQPEQLLHSYEHLLRRYCLGITDNRWDAEDLLQDTMIKLIGALEAAPNRPVTKAFLYRIAKNVWIDRQKRRRIQAESLQEMNDNQPTEDPFRSWELLEQLAHRLSSRSMVILLLSDVFSFTARETAELLLSSESAVQVALSRARARLKKLARLMDDDESVADSMKSEWDGTSFDDLVQAFRRRDPKAICRAYLGLRSVGLRVDNIRQVGGQLHFYFRDPDGNLFMISSSN